MTNRERMLAAVRGEPVDRLPFVPRLDFWHRAKKRDGTLPQGLEGLNLVEIADRLGVGCYWVIPDYTDCRDPLDMLDYTLGIYRLNALLFEPSLGGDVERRVYNRGREKVVEYHTPAGSIRTATIFTDEMLDAGASVPWRTEHPIQKPEDFDVVGYIFAHAHVASRVERYQAQLDAIGDRGIVVAPVCGSACPIHHIMRELMTVEQFFYALQDYPEKVYCLAERMEPYYEAVKEVCASSGAEVLLLGGNYDDAITYPPFFKRHILPPLRAYAEKLHQRGKFLMTHTDGENRRLIPLYLETSFDVADSVCPYPMTSVRLEDLLEAFAGRIAIMGGIPSVILCRDSASEDRFRAFMTDLLARYARQPRFILGVSDMVTADVEWDRLRYIVDSLDAAGALS
ncbi:MAG: hypothetical protein KIT09_35310 [Bryobacteraceae bacterium]|nr:hypothetical protein [Bryobacteraceae bacterium]